MLERMIITRRFFSCYAEKSRSELARLFKINQSAINIWADKIGVPWTRLKYLSDSQAISWDWIIDGIEPKNSKKHVKVLKYTKPKFHRAGINRRFLSLFPGMKQIEIAAELGVTSSTVSEWKKNKSQVPWEKLGYSVNNFDVSWNWLIDGLEPKYRERQE